MSYSSKDLVLEALSHKETYRVPIDYWGTDEVTRRLCRYFGVTSKDELLKRLGVDLRYVFPNYVGPPLKRYGDGRYEDIWGVQRKTVKGTHGSYEHTVYSPLSHIKTVDELEEWKPPSPDWYDYSSLRLQCEKYSEYATVLVGERTNRTCVLHAAMYLRGVKQALIDPLINPEFTRRLYEKITEFYLELNKRCFEEADGLIDIFMMGEDLGTQEGLLVSPKIFREFIKPYLAKHVQLAKRYGVKVMLHSCGAIRELIPDLIEMGIDILNPIQVRAKGMNPIELKREYGDKLSFHGGIDIQQTLPYGAPKDVRAEVRERIQTLGRGGVYILCTTHNIQPDTPLINILAMYEEAKKQSLR